MNPRELRILVAVGSRSDKVCSVGAFARAEARAMAGFFRGVEVLEPTEADEYPVCATVARPDVIIFHAPSLHDRKRPWNALKSAALLRWAFPKALFLSIVHEFSEAPLHWKARQIALLKLSHGVIVNSQADYDGVRPWHARVLRAHLGPTLYLPELLGDLDRATRSSRLAAAREEARALLLSRFASELSGNERWVLHPGLVTPGKGVNFLGRLAPYLPDDARLIVMGGLGPKERDRAFARRTIDELRASMKGRLAFIESPDDLVYQRFLTASDLVVLPYDVGLSERRSSFLSAMCCGANVWTTRGDFTPPLGIESTGVHSISLAQWQEADAGALRSVTEALVEPGELVVERRLKNLVWAATRTWERRIEKLAAFFPMLR